MIIKKVLNNNVALVDAGEMKEVIVWGKGLVFQKKVGDIIDEEKVEKIFPISDIDIFFRFQDVIVDIPLIYFELSSEIILLFQELDIDERKDTLLITLSDHLYSTVKRYNEGIMIKNPLTWDIKRFYPQEYQLGQLSVDVVNEKLGISLPEDEASFIAMHIINIKIDNTMTSSSANNGYKTTIMIQEILNIIRRFFKMELDEDSANYHRFVTHLKFFSQKMSSSNLKGQTKIDEELYRMVISKYVNSYKCVLKINDLLSSKYDYALTKEDELYLTVHVQRIIYQNTF